MKHGHSRRGKRTKEYSIWADMIKRCRHPGNRNSSYLLKGIKVCAEWENSFEQFLADMGKMPDGKTSIDRIDNDGNYEPSNCRWADKYQQANNRSNNHLLLIDDTIMTIAQASQRSGTNYSTIRARLRRGWPDEEAVLG